MRAPLGALMTLVLLAACGQAPVEVADAPRTGPLLGEEQPGTDPVMFADGLVSTHLDQRDTAWSPDGDEFFYSLWTSQNWEISKLINIWNKTSSNETWTKVSNTVYSEYGFSNHNSIKGGVKRQT